MQHIINLTNVCIDQNVNSVNAKDLHEFMGVKSKYSDWIKNRIKKYSFTENEDYILVYTKKEGNMAGIQVFKTVKMFGVIQELQELQADFLNNPKMYAKIGEKIRACQILRDETQKNAQSFRTAMV